MSLPCLAFSREPLCIGAAAGRRPGRTKRSGRDASAPLFRRLVWPSGLLLVYLVVHHGQWSLASEMIPAGRLGGRNGPPRNAAAVAEVPWTDLTAESAQSRAESDRRLLDQERAPGLHDLAPFAPHRLHARV